MSMKDLFPVLRPHTGPLQKGRKLGVFWVTDEQIKVHFSPCFFQPLFIIVASPCHKTMNQTAMHHGAETKS